MKRSEPSKTIVFPTQPWNFLSVEDRNGCKLLNMDPPRGVFLYGCYQSGNLWSIEQSTHFGSNRWVCPPTSIKLRDYPPTLYLCRHADVAQTIFDPTVHIFPCFSFAFLGQFWQFCCDMEIMFGPPILNGHLFITFGRIYVLFNLIWHHVTNVQY